MIDTDNVTTNDQTVLNKEIKFENLLENIGEEIHNITGIDEFVIGCALNNYCKKNVCAYETHGYCKDLLKCESARQCVKPALNNLFGCTKLNDEDK